jgi:solute carrier family 35 protein F1/2
MSDSKNLSTVEAYAANSNGESPSSAVAVNATASGEDYGHETPADQIDQKKKGFLAYFHTKEFYITLLLG